MSDAAKTLQMAVVAALDAHPVLANTLTGVFDGPPPRQHYPYAEITTGAVRDYSSKTENGREIIFAINIWDDGEAAGRLHELTGHVEDALAALPDALPGWKITANNFARTLVSRDPAGPWAGLVEQRVRMISTSSSS